MTRRVEWSSHAVKAFDALYEYIAWESPQAALRVRTRLSKAIILLSEHPIGRPGRVPGTYEKYVAKTSYIICYSLPGDDRLAILRIIHTSRDWPEAQFPD